MAFEVSRYGMARPNFLSDDKEPLSLSGWSLTPNLTRTSRSSPETHFLLDLPSEASLWSDSPHSSAVESSTETETESDEDDDFIAELAEQIAHSMLEEDESSASPKIEYSTGDGLNGPIVMRSPLDAHTQQVSPQSSWSTKSWSASWNGSAESSKHSSQVSSPPSTPSNSEHNAWELLHAAAGEVVRLRMSDDKVASQASINQPKQPVFASDGVVGTGVHSLPKSQQWKPQPSLVPLLSLPSQNSGTAVGSAPTNGYPVLSSSTILRDRMSTTGAAQAQSHRSWDRTRDEDRKIASPIAQAQYRPSKNGGWNHRQNRPSQPVKGHHHKGGRGFQSNSRNSGKSSEGHVHQWNGGIGTNGGSGMRAVFLGSGGAGRESGGTGVFLPRCVGSGSDYRRKPACSTVLLPSRIVQVLNLNVEDIRSQPSPSPASSLHRSSDYTHNNHTPPMVSYMMNLQAQNAKLHGGEGFNLQRKSQAPHLRQHVPVEFSLPTEWTY